MDLFNYNGTEATNPLESMSSDEILKAMEAGLLTGMQYNDQLNNGGGLKPESLDSVLKNLENRLDQLVFWNELNRQKIDNTVHQYNQLYKYGQEVGIFNQEGETPTETDSVYRRKSIVVKFTGVTGQVTHPGMIVKTVVGSLYTKEVENKTILLQTILDKKVIDADSAKVPEEFDGVFAQHIAGINDITGGLLGKTSEQVLDAYFGDPAVLNANGSVLNDALVEDAAQAVVNDRNGIIDRIVSSPVVFNNYVKLFHESKRVIVGMAGGVVGATMGQSVNDITTQFGKVNIKADKYFDFNQPIKLGRGKTSDKAPNAPIKDVTTPVAVAVDAKGMFGSVHAGNYFYAVTVVICSHFSIFETLETTANSLIALDVLKSVKEKNQGLFKTALGTKTEIYKKELFLGANEKQIKSLRKKFRNVTFNFLSTIATNADKKLIEGFIDFYKQVYVINDFSFSSIASENTKEEKKEILIKGLEIVKKSLK